MSLLKMISKNYKHLTQVILLVKRYFNNDRSQSHLIFQPIYKTITIISRLLDIISERKSKGLSIEKFTSHFTSNKRLSPKLVWMNNSGTRLEFKGCCLK